MALLNPKTHGEVAERFKAAVLKTVDCNRSGGSNPSLSAKALYMGPFFMPFTVYILFSPGSNRYYIGQTQDITERLQRHNAGREKATAPYIPWSIAGTIQKNSRAEAMALERKLKNLNRERLQLFIQKYCSPSGGRDDA